MCEGAHALRLLLSIWAPISAQRFTIKSTSRGFTTALQFIVVGAHFTRGLSISVTDTTDRLFNLAKTSTSTANAKSSFSLFQPCVLAPLLLGCSAGPRLITRTFDGLKTNVSAVISQRQGKRASFFSLTWECLPRHLAAAWHSL